jgi:hypothetical protein
VLFVASLAAINPRSNLHSARPRRGGPHQPQLLHHAQAPLHLVPTGFIHLELGQADLSHVHGKKFTKKANLISTTSSTKEKRWRGGRRAIGGRTYSHTRAIQAHETKVTKKANLINMALSNQK